MDFKNNSFTLDTIATLLFRMRLLSDGIAKYGDELGFTPEEIGKIQDVCASLFPLADREEEEKADVAEVFAGLREKEGETRKAVFACRKLLRGECQFADETTKKYIEERFELGQKVPKRRADFMKMAKNMIEAFDTIAVELPDVLLPPVPFERLREKFALLNTALDKVLRERAERKAATSRLKLVRGECAKTLRRVYLRATSYWGIDEPRLLELGMVDKSGVWTSKAAGPVGNADG